MSIKKILLFGTLPPVIGGVSIHLERFLHFSEKYKDMLEISIYELKKQELTTLNVKRRGWKVLFKSFFSADIIHIHISNNFKIFIALIGKIFRKKVIYTHHNSRVENKFWFNLVNYLSDIVILVNDKEIDINTLNSAKIKHIPAFLPPYAFEKLNEQLLEKINNSDFIIGTNCFRYTLINGQDLYGFDLIIEAYALLIKHNKLKNVLLLLVDPSNTAGEMIKSEILKYPWLKDNDILHINEPIDFTSLIKKSNLTIRATRSDGDSLSVRESLYLDTPIIASDITYRPEGTILFKNNNAEDLANKILDVYSNRNIKINTKMNNFAGEIINLYCEIKK